MTPASARRRFVALTALRWLPNGLAIPVTVLLAQSRGLSLAEIGVVFTAHSALVVFLELPTGGLADTLGRRPVLALSALLHLAGLLALAGARGLAGFAFAFALVGLGRALDSGPLESWYVDAVHAFDPQADVTPGLARAAAADGAALCIGAVVGGALPALAGRPDALAVPLIAAALAEVVHLVAVLALVVPVAPAPKRPGILAAGRDVPRVVRETVRLAGRDSVLRVVLAVSFGAGLVLSTLELVGPLRFAELAGGARAGSAVFGVVIATSFGLASVGAALSPRVRRIARDSAALATCAATLAAAVAVMGVAYSPAVLPAAVGYGGFYFANAAAWPVRKQLLHTRVEAARRATAVSAMSFALQLGGIAGNFLVPALYRAFGFEAAFTSAGLVLVGMALLSLRFPARTALPEPRLPSG